MINTDDIIGRVQIMKAVFAPAEMPHETRKALKKLIRKEQKQYEFTDDACCFVCKDGVKGGLQKHHLVKIGRYADRKDLNDHLMPLCQTHHSIAHKLVYGDEGGLSDEDKEKVKEQGYWQKYVQIDRLAALALVGAKHSQVEGIRKR